MAFVAQIEASLAGQTLAQRGVDLRKEMFFVGSYDQMRRGRIVHISGYSRHLIISYLQKLKAGQEIQFPDGQRAKLAVDGKHLIAVDTYGGTEFLTRTGDHRTSAGAARIADHIIAEKNRPDTGIFSAWERAAA